MKRRWLGIDEAGRGCVLGPMVFGGALVEEGRLPELWAAGVRDSKLLNAARREALVGPITSIAEAVAVLPIEAAELDARSLNLLGSTAILSLALRFRPDVLVVDAPVPPAGLEAYRQALRDALLAGGLSSCEVIAENGADRNHAVCAAASILAKVERDRRLAAIQESCGEALGSGYPSDPATQRWLAERWSKHRSFPPFVRHKWESVRRYTAAQRALF